LRTSAVGATQVSPALQRWGTRQKWNRVPWGRHRTLAASAARSRLTSRRLGPYGAKYPKPSRMRLVALGANTSSHPSMLGTIARFDVITPSAALSVEVDGRISVVGQIVRYCSGPCGTTVAFIT